MGKRLAVGLAGAGAGIMAAVSLLANPGDAQEATYDLHAKVTPESSHPDRLIKVFSSEPCVGFDGSAGLRLAWRVEPDDGKVPPTVVSEGGSRLGSDENWEFLFNAPHEVGTYLLKVDCIIAGKEGEEIRLYEPIIFDVAVEPGTDMTTVVPRPGELPSPPSTLLDDPAPPPATPVRVQPHFAG